MNSGVSLAQENWVQSSFWGVVRGTIVGTLICPLDVLKMRWQSSSGTTSGAVRIALTMLREEGIAAFYKGFPLQLLRTSIKQIWCWPIITGFPPFLQSYRIGHFQQQVLTGLSIATIDAAVSTPLERARVLSALTGKNRLNIKNIYKDGWRGFTVHWSRLCVNWMVFLTAQKYLRDRACTSLDQRQSLSQLVKIGVQVALIVSLVSAPFDVAHTLKQGKDLSPSQLLKQSRMSIWYRGWPLNLLSLIIHNIASVILIDRLERSDGLNGRSCCINSSSRSDGSMYTQTN